MIVSGLRPEAQVQITSFECGCIGVARRSSAWVVSWTQGGSSETVIADWLRLNRLDSHAASSVRSKMLSVDCALAHDTAQDLRPLWKSRFLRGPFLRPCRS